MPGPKFELLAEDVKPLYNFALGCKACQDELTAGQADLKDEKANTEALSRERDDALRAALSPRSWRIEILVFRNLPDAGWRRGGVAPAGEARRAYLVYTGDMQRKLKKKAKEKA